MIRPATVADVDHILECIRALAAYEKLSHELDLDRGALTEHLFGARPSCAALVAEQGSVPVGFALTFTSYSTFKTRPCLHLEDLFVFPEHRGRGHGDALLRAVAAEAEAMGAARLTWNVLDWNEPAIGFYRRLGAEVLPDWRTCRVEGEAIARLARGSR